MKKAEAIKRLRTEAKKFGATVEDDSVGSEITLQIVAPEGKLWRETDGPHLVVATAIGPQHWLDDAVQDGINRMRSGLYDEGDLTC